MDLCVYLRSHDLSHTSEFVTLSRRTRSHISPRARLRRLLLATTRRVHKSTAACPSAGPFRHSHRHILYPHLHLPRTTNAPNLSDLQRNSTSILDKSITIAINCLLSTSTGSESAKSKHHGITLRSITRAERPLVRHGQCWQ